MTDHYYQPFLTINNHDEHILYQALFTISHDEAFFDHTRDAVAVVNAQLGCPCPFWTTFKRH